MKHVKAFIAYLFSLIGTAFEEHKAMRRGVVVWGLWIASHAAVELVDPAVFVRLDVSVQLTLLGAVFGFPALAVGLYKWTRVREALER